MTTSKGCIALIVLLLASIPAVAEEDEKGLSGSVEVLYRNVNQNGSTAKFDEDFDGLSTGGRLGSLSLNWVDEGSPLVDYARLDAYGLGGDPFERIYGRIGSKDRYELRIDYSKQDYIYNLFELTPDQDGSAWDSERRKTDIGLTLHITKKIDVFFKYRDGDRSGSSLFMKDIQRNLFLLETPLDYELKRYTAGVKFEVGPVNFVVSQMHRRYDNDFHNSTQGDLGLEPGGGLLFSYDWMQRDRGQSDWTTITVSSPVGRRTNVTVSLLGTLLGEDELKSNVDVAQLGLDFNGNEYGGSCAISGITCGTDATCGAVTPGDVCVANQGVSNADLEGDVLVVDADVSVTLVRPLALHLRYRSLDRDFDGTALRDLDGDGIPEDVDGDGMADTRTRFDYEIETTAAVLEYRPNSKIGVRGGYKLVERELLRDGFGAQLPGEPDAFRDTDYKSDDDKTLLFGLVLRPVDWFRFNADYEDGDVEQPFTAPSLYQSEHIRARATFLPQPEMRIALSWLDFDNENTALDFRQRNSITPPEMWNSTIDGQSWSVLFTHQANERLDYDFSYAEQELDTSTATVIDLDGFAEVEDSVSVFSNENTQFRGRIQYRWGDAWRAFLQYWLAESDGDNAVVGQAFSNLLPIDQQFTNAEVGLFYTFASGVFVGATLRDFDYEDRGADGTALEGALDYDGQIFTVRGGLRF